MSADSRAPGEVSATTGVDHMEYDLGPECELGFADLFRMARGREWTPEEERRYRALSQPERNAAVRELAAEAGDIHTADRVGTDGVVYTAFWKR